MKAYNCPSCGARIALKDINVKTDVMLCRACGRTTSCSMLLQREAANKAPGGPPKRVRVIHKEATFDSPREERVEWRYGMWGVLFGAIWAGVGGLALWKDIAWYCGHASYATNPEIGIVISPLIVLTGLSFVAFTIFGKFSLSIADGWCTYFVGIGKIGRKKEFKLRRDTLVEFEAVPEKNCSGQCWKQIRIRNNDGEDVVIRSLPMDVAEYFHHWLVYWAAR